MSLDQPVGFPANPVGDEIVCINLPLIDDTQPEATEHFLLNITIVYANNALMGVVEDIAVYEIIDNDC